MFERPGYCETLQADLSAYLDGELDPAGSGRLIHHLEECRRCSARMREFRELRASLRQLPTVAAPENVLVRLRVQASRVSARASRWTYWRLRWTHAVQALALPTAVGTVTALVLFTALVGAVLPAPSVPLAVNPPGLASAGYNVNLAPVMIQARINAAGRVNTFRILTGPADMERMRALSQELRLSTFRPATTGTGRPTSGSLVISFDTVNVRG